eukprot:351773-Chlamydomonas_euryale.AAC.7
MQADVHNTDGAESNVPTFPSTFTACLSIKLVSAVALAQHRLLKLDNVSLPASPALETARDDAAANPVTDFVWQGAQSRAGRAHEVRTDARPWSPKANVVSAPRRQPGTPVCKKVCVPHALHRHRCTPTSVSQLRSSTWRQSVNATCAPPMLAKHSDTMPTRCCPA